MDECRMCPLCLMNDSAVHILCECRELEEERVKMNECGKITDRWSVKHVVRIRDVKVLDKLAKYLNRARTKRQTAIKENLHTL